MDPHQRKAYASDFVRRYSADVAADLPDNELAQFLNENERRTVMLEEETEAGKVVGFSQWLFADSSDRFEVEDLFKERRELAEVWMKFQKRHPEFSDLDIDTQQPPNIEALQTVMRAAVQDWEKRGDTGLAKAKDNFLSFSETLVSFSDLFSVIPHGDKYVSLFTGVLSTTVKAAARHKEIAEGFSTALEDISREMRFSTAVLKIHRTSEVEKLIIRLYIKHAKFFCHFMNWYLSSRWTRLKASLKNDFYTKEVKQKVTEIKDITKEIERHASLASQEQTQRTESRVQMLPTWEDMASAHMQTVAQVFQIADHSREKDMERIDQALRGVMRLLIGKLSHDLIADWVELQMHNEEVANAIRAHANSDAADGMASTSPTIQHVHPEDVSLPEKWEVEEDSTRMGSKSKTVHTRSGIEQASRVLQKYHRPVANPEAQGMAGNNPPSRLVPGPLVTKLQDWAASPRSELLWIIGLAFSNTNDASLAATHIENAVTVARMPCISFFCTLDREIPESTDVEQQSRCVSLLVAMLYSIIRGLALIMPETFEDSYDLESTISSFGGRKESIPKAMEVIRVLLVHRTPLLFVILDGLEVLENDETEPFIRELIDVLNVKDSNSRFKVLLGSRGYLNSCSGLEVEKRVDCALLPKSRLGRARPGGRFLNGVDHYLE